MATHGTARMDQDWEEFVDVVALLKILQNLKVVPLAQILHIFDLSYLFQNFCELFVFVSFVIYVFFGCSKTAS